MMKDNRSLTVLSALALGRLTGRGLRVFVEPLAGSCVRSIRVLLEAGLELAYANDIEPAAVWLCRVNSRLNSLEGRLLVSRADASEFCYTLEREKVPVDFVDVDPFGSPVYYLQPAIRLVGRSALLSVTATDTATLGGKYPERAFYRYGVSVFETPFSREVAARVLLYAISRAAAFQERAVKPLLVFYERNYVKAVVAVERASVSRLREALEGSLGFVTVDARMTPQGFVPWVPGFEGVPARPGALLGPLWVGRLCDPSFVRTVLELARSSGHEGALSKENFRRLEVLSEECDVRAPYYFNLQALSKALRVNQPGVGRLIEALRSMGYAASRTHFDPAAVKTDAPPNAVLSAFRELSSM